MQQAYKKALHRFFLKVHPDFFSRNRQLQQTNESAVAQLNELLEWGKSFKSGQYRPPPMPNIRLTFYMKVEEDGTGGGQVSSTFQLPANLPMVESSKGLCERAVNKFLRELLTKSGCLDSSLETMSQAQDELQEKLEIIKKPLRRRQHDKSAERARTLMEEASESLAETWYPELNPSIDDLIEADMVLFSTALTPQQSALGLRHLKENIEFMKYSLWYGVPVILSPGEGYSVGTDMPYTITIPWDFNLTTFQQFLKRNVDEIHRQRSEIESIAARIEQRIASICTCCDLDDVIISCGNKEALPALHVLEDNAGMLVAAGLRRTTIEISNVFGFRQNGVVVIPSTLTLTTLSNFLEKAQSEGRFQKSQMVYATTKGIIEETMWHLREFRTSVKPAGVDPNFDGAYTYAQRLQWARTLVDIGARLAQWDWSEFTFILGPLDINWEMKSMMLPFNFDGPALLKYLEEVHSTAKERHRDSLIEEDNKQKSEAHLERIAPLLDHVGREDTDHVSPFPSSSTSPAHHDSGLSRSLLRDIPRDVAEAYITSKPSDSFHVESPLSARTTFHSDADAKEHLDWEGFYQNPMLLGKEAMADEEEKERAFRMLNRTTRETLAKQMAEETAAVRESRKIKIRLGDVTGIRDPRQAMERGAGAPRGTRVPKRDDDRLD